MHKPESRDQAISLMMHSTEEIGSSAEGFPAHHGSGFGRLLGRSPRIRELHAMVEEFAAVPDPILIVGERGTGKELVARTLHALSGRRGKFVRCICGAPDADIEAELLGFGDGAGSAVSAGSASPAPPGSLELASDGTLYLDEISALPSEVQGALVHILKAGVFRPIGGNDRELRSRIVASTRLDPQAAVAAGRLRQDLLGELGAITLNVPRLADRSEDLPLLAREFLKDMALTYGKAIVDIEPEALAALERHAWPGNVQELRDAMEHAVTQEEGPTLQRTSLPPLGESDGPDFLGDGEPIAEVGMTVDDVTRRLILRTLEATNFNRTRAAEILGISSKTVYNKLKQWNVHGPSSGSSLKRESPEGP